LKELQTIKKRYVEIDSMKGFAIFFVILGHAIILFPINLHENDYCRWLFDFVSAVHVPLFFIVSGFCFSFKNGFKDFLKKKFFRIVLPYLIFNIFDIIPRVLLPSVVNHSKSLSESIIAIFLTGGGYWFLYTLFFVFLIYVPLFLMQRKNKVVQIIIECILFVGAIVLSYYQLPTNVFLLNELFYYLFFFNTGWLIKTYRNNIMDFRFKSNFLGVLVPLLLLAAWIAIITVKIIIGYSILPRVLTTLLAIVAVFFFTRFNWFNRIFMRFGAYSLQLYLFNGFLLVASRVIICKLTTNPALIISFNMLIDFFLSYLFIKYLWSKVKFFRLISGM